MLNLGLARTRLLRGAVLPLTVLLLLVVRGGPPVAHGDATLVASVPCSAIAGLIDGNAGNALTAADTDAACGIGGTPLPPTGTRSMAGLSDALGDRDGVLEYSDFIGIPSLNLHQIAVSCTAPSPTCTLDSFVFVNDEAQVTFDLPAGLASVETGGDYRCTTDGVTLTTDNDCSNTAPNNGDGVVLAHIINGTAADGADLWVNAEQEGVIQSFEVHVGSVDADGDGMPDAYESVHACLNASIADGGGDPDADGASSLVEYSALGTDPCVADSDADTVVDGTDNCPLVANTDQTNTDSAPIVIVPGKAVVDISAPNGDPLGDACDPDKDNDGLPDAVEESLGTPSPPGLCQSATAPTNPLLMDSDGDRVTDGAECALGTDPMNAASKPPVHPEGDADFDGLPDALELILGSDPAKIDSDGDRINDAIEFKGYNTSPALRNTDGDICPDGREIASVNGDLKVDTTDQFLVAQSFNRRDRPALDVNKDGIVNTSDQLLVAMNVNSFHC